MLFNLLLLSKQNKYANSMAIPGYFAKVQRNKYQKHISGIMKRNAI